VLLNNIELSNSPIERKLSMLKLTIKALKISSNIIILCGVNTVYDKLYIRFGELSFIMPSKNMAALLSNESNLRIIEMLKSRPYYPREMALEMGLSEPFIVRRLRSMEECGIVESKWENKGNKRVKRYFLKDITLELADKGLKIKTDNAPLNIAPIQYTFNLKDEIIKWAMVLPFIAIIISGIIFNTLLLLIPLIIGIYCLWCAAINFAYYRRFGLKSNLLAIFTDLIIPFIVLVIVIEGKVYDIELKIVFGVLIFTTAILFLILMAYRAGYKRLEMDKINKSKITLKDIISSEPSYVKAFYLPIAVKWKFF